MEEPQGAPVQKNIVNIDPSEWARTPPTLQNLILWLVEQLQLSQDSVRDLLRDKTPPHAELCKRLFQISAERSPKARQVVFVSDSPSTRIAKLAYGLRQNGWKPVLLYKIAPGFNISEYFTESYTYVNADEAVLLASGFSPEVFHCFSSWNFDTSAAIIKACPNKVVFDDYDIFAGCLKPDFVEEHNCYPQIEIEKFCLENAAGLCCRGIQLNVAKRKLGYKHRGKIIFFPEYCWNRPESVLARPVKRRTDGVHAVYVGGLNPAHYDTPEGRLCVCDRDFIQRITARGIHYHLYPYESGAWDDSKRERYESYIAEDVRNEYFHFHDPLPIEELIPEIAQYHFGLVSMARQVPLEGDHAYEHYTHNFGTINKVFDYIDAGLMVVSYGYKVVERLLQGACIVAERSEVPEVLAKFSPEGFDSRFLPQIQLVRHQRAVWRQAQRLIEFYRSI